MSHTYYNSLDTALQNAIWRGACRARGHFSPDGPGIPGLCGPPPGADQGPRGSVHYRMEFAGQTPQQNHFTFTIAPTTPGLYFYHFDLYTDFRRIYRDAGGEGVLSWTDGTDWQLTVYEPDFKTPDWIKNGTMYQIFPDRFCEGKPASRCLLPTASTARTRPASPTFGPPSSRKAT